MHTCKPEDAGSAHLRCFIFFFSSSHLSPRVHHPPASFQRAPGIGELRAKRDSRREIQPVQAYQRHWRYNEGHDTG